MEIELDNDGGREKAAGIRKSDVFTMIQSAASTFRVMKFTSGTQLSSQNIASSGYHYGQLLACLGVTRCWIRKNTAM
jgi:hypothetical protein